MHLELTGTPGGASGGGAALPLRAEPLSRVPTTAPSVWLRVVALVVLVLLGQSVVLGTWFCGGGGARSSKNAGSPSQPHPKPSA